MTSLSRILLVSSLLLSGCAPAIEVQATAYSQPGKLTASGTKAGIGQIAVSRDLLSRYPYGSKLRLVSVKGKSCHGYSTAILRVTDTMASYIYNSVDVHLPTKSLARHWGKCIAVINKVR